MPPLGGARLHIGFIHKPNLITVPLVQLNESQVNSSHESCDTVANFLLSSEQFCLPE